MRKILMIFLLLAAVIACVAIGSQLLAPKPASPTLDAIGESVSTPVVALTTEVPTVLSPLDTPEPDLDPVMPHMLFMDMPEMVQVGTVPEATIILFGSADIAELSFEVRFPLEFIYVRDDDATVEGDQVMPILSEGAVALVNEANSGSSGESLLYRVSNLGFPVDGDPNRPILTMHLNVVSPGFPEIAFENVSALDRDGNVIQVEAQNTFVETVMELPGGPGDAATPEPTALPTPEPTPVVIMTPEPTLEATPLVLASGDIESGVYYRLQAEQTLYQVAQAFGSTPEEIAAANGIVDVTAIAVNTLLRIPVESPVGRAAYFVAPRETFYSIAGTFDLKVEDLALWNNIAPPYSIQAGQWIVLHP